MTRRGKKESSIKLAWPWWRLMLITLTIFALAISLILSWHFITGDPMAGCGGESPCEQVLSSRWSMAFGIMPVSALASGVYLSLLVTLFFIGSKTEKSIKRLAWIVLLILAGAIFASAIWFTILQKWFIGEYCSYCMTAHFTGLVIAILIYWQAQKNTGNYFKRRNRMLIPVISGIFLAGAITISQITFSPSVIHNEQETQISMEFDYQNIPMKGSHDAMYIVNILFDYQCPHCQRLHFLLDETINKYNGKLAFALCPVPLNNQCNQYIPPEADAYKNSCELTRISMAVWVANREVFSAFDTWMFSFETGQRWRPKTPETAKIKAIEMVGKDVFEAAYSNPWIDEYIQASVELYGGTIQNNNRGIPRMVYESNWVIPEPYSVDDIIKALQENLKIPHQ